MIVSIVTGKVSEKICFLIFFSGTDDVVLYYIHVVIFRSVDQGREENECNCFLKLTACFCFLNKENVPIENI